MPPEELRHTVDYPAHRQNRLWAVLFFMFVDLKTDSYASLYDFEKNNKNPYCKTLGNGV
jgi:hypothetical protein